MGGNLRERHRPGREEGGEMRGRRPAAVLGEQMTSMAGKSGGPELGFGIFGDGGGWDLAWGVGQEQAGYDKLYF